MRKGRTCGWLHLCSPLSFTEWQPGHISGEGHWTFGKLGSSLKAPAETNSEVKLLLSTTDNIRRCFLYLRYTRTLAAYILKCVSERSSSTLHYIKRQIHRHPIEGYILSLKKSHGFKFILIQEARNIKHPVSSLHPLLFL